MTKSKVKALMQTGKFKKYSDSDIDQWSGGTDYGNSTSDYLKALRDGTSNY
jgi:hypothetical protein